jgi:hypothetical protein
MRIYFPFMRNNGLYSNWNYEGEDYYEPSYYIGEEGDNQYGDVVLDKEMDTKNLSKSGNMYHLTWICKTIMISKEFMQ